MTLGLQTLNERTVREVLQDKPLQPRKALHRAEELQMCVRQEHIGSPVVRQCHVRQLENTTGGAPHTCNRERHRQ